MTIFGRVGVGHCPGRRISRAVYFSAYLLQAKVGPPSRDLLTSVFVQEHRDLILGEAISVSFCHCMMPPFPCSLNQL